MYNLRFLLILIQSCGVPDFDDSRTLGTFDNDSNNEQVNGMPTLIKQSRVRNHENIVAGIFHSTGVKIDGWLYTWTFGNYPSIGYFSQFGQGMSCAFPLSPFDFPQIFTTSVRHIYLPSYRPALAGKFRHTSRYHEESGKGQKKIVRKVLCESTLAISRTEHATNKWNHDVFCISETKVCRVHHATGHGEFRLTSDVMQYTQHLSFHIDYINTYR